MTQFDKLLLKVRQLDNNMRFQEVKWILETYGYSMKSPSGGSSHMTFRKKGSPPITIPRHSPIKHIYIQMVKEIVEEEESSNDN